MEGVQQGLTGEKSGQVGRPSKTFIKQYTIDFMAKKSSLPESGGSGARTGTGDSPGQLAGMGSGFSLRRERAVFSASRRVAKRLSSLPVTASAGEAVQHALDLRAHAGQVDQLAARAGLKRVQAGPVDLSALKGRELLSLGPGHRLRVIIQHLADTAGAHVSTEYEGTSLDAVRQMATRGAGVAIPPNLYAVVGAQGDPSQVVRPI